MRDIGDKTLNFSSWCPIILCDRKSDIGLGLIQGGMKMSALLEEKPKVGQSGVVVLRGLVDPGWETLSGGTLAVSKGRMPSGTAVLRVVSREAHELFR